MFTDVGQLEILTPLPDPMFPAFDFQRCPMNVQEILMDPQLQVDVCKVCDRNCLDQCSRHPFFFFFFLTLIFERERESMGQGQREKETQNLKQAPW